MGGGEVGFLWRFGCYGDFSYWLLAVLVVGCCGGWFVVLFFLFLFFYLDGFWGYKGFKI